MDLQASTTLTEAELTAAWNLRPADAHYLKYEVKRHSYCNVSLSDLEFNRATKTRTRYKVSMQSRWKLDKYLSYLSSPPLLCYYSSLWSPVRQKGGTKKRGEEREKRNSETFFCVNVQVRRGREAADRQTTWRTDGRVDDSLPGAQTSQGSSAESHTYQSDKVCELPEIMSLNVTGRSVFVRVGVELLLKTKPVQQSLSENCVAAFENLVMLFRKHVHQHEGAESKTAGSYRSKSQRIWRYSCQCVSAASKAVHAGFSLSYKFEVICVDPEG